MHFSKFDHLTILIKEEHRQANIDWYINLLGLEPKWDSPDNKLTCFKLPSQQIITLLSEYPDSSETINEGVRVCFITHDLKKTKLFVEHEGIFTSQIYVTPWGMNAFDFSDLQGTRLTVTSIPNQQDKKIDYNSKFSSFFLHINVGDLRDTKEWYSNYLGMISSEINHSESYVLMRMPEDKGTSFPIFFSNSSFDSRINSSNKPSTVAIRPFFQISGKSELEYTQHLFNKHQIKTNEIQASSDDFMKWFDFEDLYGNQLHAISY
ncbi:VOC family protein [Chengkuizengella axinellae]|uniref:VOC family protein n=1 Tax=Chengkuizengella axinellae TaxID=3064388 RepID=A0ABT9IWX1_9BACL|nr:VOC family protein [Chengkuizengella sp. 2205SS18-9]MDP5273865.1 VOC family protein [Chengkuizengella sp. 2205SS18-9]